MSTILYLGSSSEGSTSSHRADALKRLGHDLVFADPYLALFGQLTPRIQGALHYRTGYRLLQPLIERWLVDKLQQPHLFDIAWVDGGELFGPHCIRLLRSVGLLTVLYNHDDPTGKRDGHRFDTLVKSLPIYDVCAVVRKENVQEYRNYGAKCVLHVWRSYDEVQHAPYQLADEIPDDYLSEVAFIGTWMRGEGRDQFVLDLMECGISVSIWGQRWEKSPLWKKLKCCYRGGNLSGRNYVAAIQGAKVCLGMLSRGNRDLHTTRSMEIPYAGGVLCAERTSEHLALYKENVEAVFWSDVNECAQQCQRLLDDDAWRRSVRHAGMARVRASHLGHEDICRTLIDAALKVRSAKEQNNSAA
ncbi:glycosyltransferase [Rhodoferax sp.]|uniref:CgeB family protein n=1 Tax=Rhodoferax sp. TaxID=50421 RepID=UPI00283E32AD|nr:glycosyltransferase [Rhodoferax sp.]MDR3368610.1 glycosyltransferase [Rhodoferax sp.]